MPICYLDRDGVINHHLPYVGSWDRFILHNEIILIMKNLKKRGYSFVIVTNQSGIGRGYYTLSDFEKLNIKMKDLFLKHKLEFEIRFCPHKPSENCGCRKPKTGMFNKDVRNPFDILIGDQESDMKAALNAKINYRWLINHSFKSNLATNNFSKHHDLLKFLDSNPLVF